uniref:Uncharacterized protein n=1 Tax=Panagrolaimus sp. JU765 TaxID=591449 RepID=A0AC34QVF7_9BILA
MMKILFLFLFLIVGFGLASEETDLCKRKPYLLLCRNEDSDTLNPDPVKTDTENSVKDSDAKLDPTKTNEIPNIEKKQKITEIKTVEEIPVVKTRDEFSSPLASSSDSSGTVDYEAYRLRRAKLLRKINELDNEQLYGSQSTDYYGSYPYYSRPRSSNYYYPSSYGSGYSSSSYYPSYGNTYYPSNYGYGSGYGQPFTFGIGSGLNIGIPNVGPIGVGTGLGVTVG